MRKVMGPFVIVSVQTYTVTINKHSIHKTVSIDGATLAHGYELSTSASQRFPIGKEPPTENGISRQSTPVAHTDYAIDRIVLYKDSGNDLCYRVRRYE